MTTRRGFITAMAGAVAATQVHAGSPPATSTPLEDVLAAMSAIKQPEWSPRYMMLGAKVQSVLEGLGPSWRAIVEREYGVKILE